MVPPKLNAINKKILRDAHRKESQRHSCSQLVGWSCGRLVEHPSKKLCQDNGGNSRLRLLNYLTIRLTDYQTTKLFCLRNSEVHSTSALLPRLHRVGLDTFLLDQRLGSLEIALKCTRPRQRFWLYVGRDFMTERGKSQGGKYPAELFRFYGNALRNRITFAAVSSTGRVIPLIFSAAFINPSTVTLILSLLGCFFATSFLRVSNSS